MKAAAVIIAILAGCATNQVDFGPRDPLDIISRDELAAHSFTTAYEAIAYHM